MSDLNLKDWFLGRPIWLQDTAQKIIDGNEFSEKDYGALAEMCINEVILGDLGNSGFSFSESAFGEGTSASLRLNSIGEIEGINSLAPKKSLKFGTGNLAVIYGLNGSGKSGYVRILKHACGARHPGNLHKNVYANTSPDQKCKIAYEKDGAEVPIEWTPDNRIIADLRSVDIFDSLCGKVYATDENEVTYEPPVLSFFTELIEICEKVSQKLDDSIGKLPAAKPQLPKEYTISKLGKWYIGLSAKTTAKEISTTCEWSEDLEKELQALQERLSEKAPAEKAKLIRKQKQHLDTLIGELKSNREKFSDVSCQKILDLKQVAETKKKAAEAAAEKVFSEAPLEGIGTNEWKELWEKARQYSEQKAYKEVLFPNTLEDALCVLCQQSLSDEAKSRFNSFESFVKGELEEEAAESVKALKAAVEKLEELPLEKNIKTAADAAEIKDEEFVSTLVNYYKSFKDRQEKLQQVDSVEKMPVSPECDEWLKKAEAMSQAYEESAIQYDKDGKSDNRSELESNLLEFHTHKWLSQQKKSIEKEAERLSMIEVIKEAKKLSSTTALSKKKGDLAKLLITKALVTRFNQELKNLGAQSINVELVKTRVNKGRVLHQLRLCSKSQCTLDDVLSEGEYRIICLAAFFADVAGKAHSAPFVFDDPISSLDQDYEEAVVQRLVELSQDRQLIVFTHRLSLLGLLQDYGKKVGREPEVICLRQEPWGTGEPGGTPLFAKKPGRALNSLINDRLSGAKKIYEGQGQEFYEPIAKSLCSDFRIILERMIENDLLADVVHRYRRAINTVGKIDKLARVSRTDCTFFDDMMTKYSRYEHSQSTEAPVPVPLPDELSTDFNSLKTWRDEFVSRGV